MRLVYPLLGVENMTTDVPVTSYSAIVGWALREERSRIGLSQSDVAMKLQIGQSAWAKIEKGHVPIHIIQLAKFADLLNLKPHKIIEKADRAAAQWVQNGKELHYERSPAGRLPAGAGQFLLGAALGGALALLITANVDEDGST